MLCRYSYWCRDGKCGKKVLFNGYDKNKKTIYRCTKCGKTYSTEDIKGGK